MVEKKEEISLLEKEFDIKHYVEERLREIKELDERRYAKEIIAQGLLNIFQMAENKYQKLEKRIINELEIPADKFVVSNTIIHKSDYDPTNDTLFPIYEEDINKSNEQQNNRICIYFEGNGEKRKAFENIKSFSGYIVTKGTKIPCEFGLSNVNHYHGILKELYEIFAYNQVPWTTVNTGYLDCFYEMRVSNLEAEEFDEYEIDFGMFADCIQYEMIPLWNIEKFQFQCMQFMIPCIQDTYYEHELDFGDYGLGHGYMIGINQDIIGIRYEKDKIIMTSEKESFQNWVAYRFAGNANTSSLGYHYPLLTNERRDNFLKRYSEHYHSNIWTKTELFRKVESFEINQYIEIKDYYITDTFRGEALEADMNWFIKGEVFPMETRKLLVLVFGKKSTHQLLCDSMVRFVISQLQMEMKEYKCVGVYE